MGFLRFLWREHVLKWTLLAFVLLDMWGRVSAAKEIYTVLPHWAWEPIGMAVFAGGILWTLYKWHEQLQSQWDSMKATPAVRELPRRDPREAFLVAAHTAVVNSGFTLAEGRSEETRREALANLRAIVMTGHREFGLTVPGTYGSTTVQIKDLRDYLKQVSPFIKQGHDDEARRISQQFE